jgi:hypothetical protein
MTTNSSNTKNSENSPQLNLICHAETRKEEIIDWLNKNKGKQIKFHYDWPGAGDDDVVTGELTDTRYNWIVQMAEESVGLIFGLYIVGTEEAENL